MGLSAIEELTWVDALQSGKTDILTQSALSKRGANRAFERLRKGAIGAANGDRQSAFRERKSTYEASRL